jgi:hypothetical protein
MKLGPGFSDVAPWCCTISLATCATRVPGGLKMASASALFRRDWRGAKQGVTALLGVACGNSMQFSELHTGYFSKSVGKKNAR